MKASLVGREATRRPGVGGAGHGKAERLTARMRVIGVGAITCAMTSAMMLACIRRPGAQTRMCRIRQLASAKAWKAGPMHRGASRQFGEAQRRAVRATAGSLHSRAGSALVRDQGRPGPLPDDAVRVQSLVRLKRPSRPLRCSSPKWPSGSSLKPAPISSCWRMTTSWPSLPICAVSKVLGCCACRRGRPAGTPPVIQIISPCREDAACDRPGIGAAIDSPGDRRTSSRSAGWIDVPASPIGDAAGEQCPGRFFEFDRIGLEVRYIQDRAYRMPGRRLAVVRPTGSLDQASAAISHAVARLVVAEIFRPS